MDVSHFLRHCYGIFLHLYPKAYREEYGEELQTVFDLALDDALEAGKLEVTRVGLRELSGLPNAILHEHLRERRKKKMIGKSASRFDFVPGSRTEIWAALAPFFLFGALPVLFNLMDNNIALPVWLKVAARLLLILSVLFLFVLGFVKRVPRWSLPYLGLPLPVFSLLLFNALPEFPVLFNKLYDISWFSGAFVFGGMVLMGMLLAVILIVLLTGLVPRFRPFHRRLREDWTLLCFLIYGALPFIIVLEYESYRNEEPFMILAFLVLAGGVWLYLRNTQPWKKFLSLFGAMTLAMLVTMAGQELLYESSFPSSGFPSWTTTMGSVIFWIWMTLFMLLSLTLNLLPRPRNHPEAA